MIRKCTADDFESIHSIINTAAQAYYKVIPQDCWREPYMSRKGLKHEIDSGVIFWGNEEDEKLTGVMGIQHIKDVTLIRHAYVLPSKQRLGIGSSLLATLRRQTTQPILVGTWADALWAVRFYEKNGFRLVSEQEKDKLLSEYWTITARQIATSVVLANRKWFERQGNQRVQYNRLN